MESHLALPHLGVQAPGSPACLETVLMGRDRARPQSSAVPWLAVGRAWSTLIVGHGGQAVTLNSSPLLGEIFNP